MVTRLHRASSPHPTPPQPQFLDPDLASPRNPHLPPFTNASALVPHLQECLDDGQQHCSVVKH